MVRLEHMLLVSLFSWWYGLGWLKMARQVSGRVHGVLTFFSVGSLLGSLFAPYRQIAAGRVQGPAGVQLRAWGDRLFSRLIGAVVRLILVAVGLVGALAVGVTGLLLIVAWPLLPVAPIIGLFLMSAAWVSQ